MMISDPWSHCGRVPLIVHHGKCPDCAGLLDHRAGVWNSDWPGNQEKTAVMKKTKCRYVFEKRD